MDDDQIEDVMDDVYLLHDTEQIENDDTPIRMNDDNPLQDTVHEKALWRACKQSRFNDTKDIINRISSIDLLCGRVWNALEYFIINNGPGDILILMIDRLNNKQKELDRALGLVRFNSSMSDDNLKILLEKGANPNAIIDDIGSNNTILWHSVSGGVLRRRLSLMIEYGGDPNVKNKHGQYLLDICVVQDELFMIRYGATQFNPCMSRVLNPFVIIDMMLYNDMPSEWKREIKECMY